MYMYIYIYIYIFLSPSYNPPEPFDTNSGTSSQSTTSSVFACKQGSHRSTARDLSTAHWSSEHPLRPISLTFWISEALTQA